MIGGDAIGFHAVGEFINNAPPPLLYKMVSRLSTFASGFFKKRS